MNAREGQRLEALRGAVRRGLARIHSAAAAELPLRVEEQRPRSRPRGDGERGECAVFGMKLDHARKIDRTEHVHVVHQKRLFGFRAGALAGFEEEPGSLLQAAAGVEQDLLVRDLDPHVEVAVGREIRDDLIGKVVNVDDRFTNTKAPQPRERNLQQRSSADRHERLGTVVSERPQPRAQAGGKDHGFHCGAFSRCQVSRARCGAPQPLRPLCRASARPAVPLNKPSGAARPCSRRKPSDSRIRAADSWPRWRPQARTRAARNRSTPGCRSRYSLTGASRPVSCRNCNFAPRIGQTAGIEDEASAVARLIGGQTVMKREAEDAHRQAGRGRGNIAQFLRGLDGIERIEQRGQRHRQPHVVSSQRRFLSA